jgi:predicted nucleotidyltransferase
MVNTELILARNILKTNYDINPNKVVGVYPYGSILYGTVGEKSDLDLVVIVDMIKNDYLQYESEDLDIHFMSEKHYKNKLLEHDIMALECFYNPSPYLEYPVQFKFDKPTLRKRISAICNNSWAKAGKKLNLPEEDDYIGLKSLFHSFRILSYGIDIARENKIDFTKVGNTSAVDFWNEIIGYYKQGFKWDDFKQMYKKEHNVMATEFRELAPKE